MESTFQWMGNAFSKASEGYCLFPSFLLSEVGPWMRRKKQYSNVRWPTFLTHQRRM